MNVLIMNACLATSQACNDLNLNKIIQSEDKRRINSNKFCLDNWENPQHQYINKDHTCLSNTILSNNVVVCRLRNNQAALRQSLIDHIELNQPQYAVIEIPKISRHITLASLNTKFSDDYHIQYEIYNTKDFDLAQSRFFTLIIMTRKDKVQPDMPLRDEDSGKTVGDIMDRHVASRYYIEEEFFSFPSPKIVAGVHRIGVIRIGNDISLSQCRRVFNRNFKSCSLQCGSGGWGARTGIYETDFGYRILTPRECQRLQGIDIDLKGSDVYKYNFINQSIVYPCIYKALENIKNVFDIKF